MGQTTQNGTRFYEQWYDRRQEASPSALAGWDGALAAADERERCLNLWRIAKVARGIPRRLGSAAVPAELAADKKFWARATSLYLHLAQQWERIAFGAGDFSNRSDNEHVRQAVRKTTEDFVEEAIAAVQANRTTAITLTAQQGDFNLANRMAFLYERELDDLARLT